MKAMLRFTLPQESEEHQLALDGWKWRIVAEEMDHFLRNKLKYEDLTEEDDEIYQSVRDELQSLIDNQGLALW
jgi:hypothetical protein